MGLGFARRTLEFYDFRWSYSGFHHFRKRLAAEIELNLDEMCGFGGKCIWPDGEPIVLLLNHSDCEGNLTPSDCESIYPRLIELVANWPNDDYDKITAIKLAKAMKECAYEGQHLEFR